MKMAGEESKATLSGGNQKTYSRSSSWTDRSPSKSNSKPKWSSKARACLPPLQPLSISKPSFDEWPSPGSDDIGVWLNSPVPGLRPRFLTPRESSIPEQGQREIALPRDKLAFFKKECSKIVDYIYLGSDTVAKNREVLLQNGITHVLNCVGFVCPEYFKNDFVYKTLWLHDSPSEDITSILYDVFDYFEDVREQGGRVFVHCCQGVSRSTSLVIAYLMWKEGHSFEDAFQHVKAARGVTNPNMGFACQLLQCQKRVHALPASPSSVLRMYRLTPHSPYDPLHLVPKRLIETGTGGLDSRGAFIIHIPVAIYVWVGKHCIPMMEDNARAAAFQVIRYEKARGPAEIIREGEEPSEFWEALGTDTTAAAVNTRDGQRKVDDYDLDFEIFHKALSGGVVPPFPLSGNGSETRLPARETGWSRLRSKFVRGIMKDFITSAKLSCTTPETSHDLEMVDTFKEVDCSISPIEPSSPSTDHCDSPDSFSSYATSSPGWVRDSSKEEEHSVRLPDPLMSSIPSFSSLESFCKPKSRYASPSLSPAASEYSSSFTFSPSSSNWSDLSYASAQPSPSGLEPKDLHPSKSASSEDCACLLYNGKSSPPEEAFSASWALRMFNSCSPCRGTSPSLAERRGSIPPPRMMLPSVDEASQVHVNLVRSCSFSLPDSEDEIVKDMECDKPKEEDSFEMNKEESMLDSDKFVSQDDKNHNIFHTLSNDIADKVAEVANLVIYQWPSMRKVDMHYDALDSSSVYIIYVSDKGTDNADALYIRVGRDVSWKGSHNQLICIDSIGKDVHVWLKTVGHHFLSQRGLATNCLIQIVKEGEEPEQLLKHLPCFSFQKALDSRV